MRDRFIYLVLTIVALTIVSAASAVLVAFFTPSPASLAMERLFETFLSFSAAGFFALLGLLTAFHSHVGQ